MYLTFSSVSLINSNVPPLQPGPELRPVYFSRTWHTPSIHICQRRIQSLIRTTKALMPQKRASILCSSPWHDFTFKNIVATSWQVLDLPIETPKKSADELDDTPTEVTMKAVSIP